MKLPPFVRSATATIGQLRRSRAATASASYLLSALLPMLVGLLVVPPTLRQLGPESFGILTLYWAVLTLLSNFDFGVSQTLIKLLAARGEQRLDPSETRIATSAYVIQLGIGSLVAVAMAIFTYFLPPPQRATIWGDYLLTYLLFLATVPLLSLTVGLRATLEAKLDFQFVSMTSLLAGLTQFLIPFALSKAGLQVIILATLAVRVGILLTLLGRLVHRCGLQLSALELSKQAFVKVRSAGAWIAFSNILNPMIAYVDRLLLPFFLPLKSIAFYALPMELLQRLMIVPAVINRIGLSYLSRAGPDGEQIRLAVYKKTTALMSMYGTLLLFGALIVPYLIAFWLGADFMEQSAYVTQLVLVGMSFSGLAYLSANMLITQDRADIEPKIQLGILPFFLAIVLTAMIHHSLIGVAAGWCFRIAAHSVALLLAVRKQLPSQDRWITTAQLAFHTLAAGLVLVVIAAR